MEQLFFCNFEEGIFYDANSKHFGESPILIGEPINSTGKKRFKQALFENDIDYILSEGVKQQERVEATAWQESRKIIK